MGTYRRWIAVAAAAVLTLGVIVGCIELKQEADVYPDGSGRILVRASSEIGRPFDDPDLTERTIYEEVAATSAGLVAITEAKVQQRGSRRTIEFVGWFEALSDVRLEYAGSTFFTFDWQRGGADYELTANFVAGRDLADQARRYTERMGELDREVRDAPARTRKQTVALAERERSLLSRSWNRVLDGLELEAVFRLPGRIQTLSGFEQVDDRTVRIRLDGDQLRDERRVQELLAREYVVSFDASLTTKAQEAEFATRLADARRVWERDPASRTIALEHVRSVGDGDAQGQALLLPGGERLVTVGFDEPPAPARLLHVSGAELGELDFGAVEFRDAHPSPGADRVHLLDRMRRQVVTRELPSGKFVWELSGSSVPGWEEWRIAVAADGNLFVDKASEGIHLYDGRTGRHLRVVVPDGSMQLQAAAHDPSHLVVSQDDVFRVLDVAGQRQLWYDLASVGGVQSSETNRVLAWRAYRIPDGLLLLVSTSIGGSELAAHDEETGKLRWRASSPGAELFVHPNSRYGFVPAPLGAPRVVDLETGEDLGRVTGLPRGSHPLGVGSTGGFWVRPSPLFVQQASEYRLRLK